MKKIDSITHLDELLERLGEVDSEDDRVALGSMIEIVGEKTFGPLLVIAGLIAFSPLSGIPGVPTMVALIVLLTTIQLLLGRKFFWLPRWLTRKTISRDKYEYSLKTIAPAARFVDRFFRPRLTCLTRRMGTYLVAISCILIAIAMPPLEIMPFAATIAGAAIVAFGLALMARDGFMTLLALLFTATAGTVAMLSFFEE